MTQRKSTAARVFAVLLCAGCRAKTEWNSEVTSLCTSQAATEISAIQADGGMLANGPMEYKLRCERCCRDHDLDSVEAGPCACGKLGFDVLLR